MFGKFATFQCSCMNWAGPDERQSLKAATNRPRCKQDMAVVFGTKEQKPAL